ncbi:MAG: hypothetical protein QM756_06840 [Polyangiaceae bacterium]
MKTSALAAWFGCVALGLLSGCSETLDPGSRVVSMRVLAQDTDLPFAAPGETVHVSSLAYDPEGRSVNWAWAVCVNPSSSSVDGCVEKLSQDAQSAGSIPLLAMGAGVDSVDVTVPDDALSSLPESARESASLGVLSVACPGTFSLETGAAGLPFRCADAASGRQLGLDEFVIGVKRISVRAQDRNQNPLIASVRFDGAEWLEGQVLSAQPCDKTGNDFSECAKSLQHRLAINVSPESFESGRDEFGDFTEQVVVQYFATEGNFESDFRIAKSPETKWAPRREATDKDVTFWLVARDNRGGVSWTTRTLRVE